jgi:GNAT superfamily N-acetyltransferase
MTAEGIRVRVGGTADAAWVLPLYDQAVAWLAASGRAGQWGTEPWSAQPDFVARLNRVAEDAGLRVAEADDHLAGAVRLTRAPWYVPAAAEPELYLEGFVVDRRYGGRDIGRTLLEAARAEAAGSGARQLRLDCWADGDQALVRYYEHAGFTATGRVTLPRVLGGWEGTILTRRL